MRLQALRPRRRVQRVLSVTLALAATLLAACSNGGDTTTPDTPTMSIALSAATVAATPSAPGTVSVTVTRGGGYTGAVTLTAENLPANVTASFNPAIVQTGSTASVLTLTAAPNASAATTTITVRGTGTGSVSASTATTSLTVTVPAINITPGSNGVTGPAGTPVSLPVTIDRTGGFTGAVNLSVENLPSNVTGSFSPSTIQAGSTTSTLTLTSNALTALGTFTVTIRAGGTGVADKTVTFQYTVTSAGTPDYTLSATPASLSVVAGVGGSSTINVNRTGAFAGNVTLGLSGAPTGVGGSFSPNPAAANTSTLTLTTTAATVPGTYTLTVTGTAAGLTDHTTTISLVVTAAPALTVALSPTSLSFAAGTSAQTSVTVARIGGLTGDVTMTADAASLPTGVTVAFAPSPVTGTSTTATVSATAATAPGTYNVVLRGTNGAISGTATLAVTITSAQGISVALVPTSLTVAQGATGTITANITRTGGYAGTVNLAVTGLPSTITTTFNPVAVTGNSSTISLIIGSGVAAGTYNGTLTASGAGVTTVNVPFTLTVTSGGGGGGGNIAYQFCDATRIPIYFAVRDGASGSWTKLTATGSNTYSFSLSQSVGSVAYVIQTGSSFATTVMMQTAAEIAASATSECVNNPGTGKTVTGSVAGLGATESAAINLGSAAASVNFPATTFSLAGVPNGSLDLVAVRSGINLTTFATEPNKMIIRRGLNQAAGSVIPVLDFGAAEAFAPQASTLTLTNLGTDNAFVQSLFVTGGGTTGVAFNGGIPSNSTTRTIYGVPTANLGSGDLHEISVIAQNAGSSSSRIAQTYFRTFGARTLTLGPTLNAPTITTSLTASVLRPRAQGTLQAEYNQAVTVSFQQGTRSVTISVSKGYLGAATTYDLEVPDLSPTGYLAAWGLTPTGTVTYSMTGIGGVGSAISDGTTVSLASITGSFAASAIRR